MIVSKHLKCCLRPQQTALLYGHTLRYSNLVHRYRQYSLLSNDRYVRNTTHSRYTLSPITNHQRTFSTVLAVTNTAPSSETHSQSIQYANELGQQFLQTNVLSADNLTTAYNNGYAPIQYSIDLLNYIHHTTGFNWWSTLIATAVALRVVTLPLSVLQINTAAKVDSLRYPLSLIYSARQQSRRPKLSLQTIKQSRDYVMIRSVTRLRKLMGCQSYKQFLNVAVQIPIYISVAMSIRILATFDPSLQHGGILWFTNLTQPDPYNILPFTAVALTIYSLHRSRQPMIQAINKGVNVSIGMKTVDYMLKAMQLVIFSLSFYLSTLPSGIFVYWITAILWSILQSCILRSQPVTQYLSRLHPPMLPPDSTVGRQLSDADKQTWRHIIPLVDDVVAPLKVKPDPNTVIKANIIDTQRINVRKPNKSVSNKK